VSKDCAFDVTKGADMPVLNKGKAIVETPVEARAGFLDRPVLWVLVISTALVAGLFALIYLGFFTAWWGLADRQRSALHFSLWIALCEMQQDNEIRPVSDSELDAVNGGSAPLAFAIGVAAGIELGLTVDRPRFLALGATLP
jgi:hypothetical protein